MEKTAIPHTGNIPSRGGPVKKILFANVPADGHFNPLTGLAVHLKNMGYDVRWYTASNYADKLKKMDIPFYPFKKAFGGRSTESVDELFPARVPIKGQIKKLNYDLSNFFILRSPEYYADIKEIYASFPFDLLIADCMFTAIPLVKEKLRVPVFSVGIIPLLENSKDLAPVGLGLTPAQNFLTKQKHALLRFLAVKVLFRKPDQLMKKMLQGYGISSEGANLFDIVVRKSTLLLQSGTPGFEYTRSDMGKNIRFIGPLYPYQPEQQSKPWYNSKLRDYDKVILVTQGTVEKDIEKIIVPTLEAFKDSSCLVIATTGGTRTDELTKRYPQANIIIKDFIPFNDIMPYADVYVSNGGYGGVMLGIQHRLPMIVAGVHEGKNEINARVGFFKLGINLGTEKPTPEQVKHAVEEVLNDAVYSNHVQQLSMEFGHYNPTALCAAYVAETLQPALQRTRGSNYIKN